MQFSHGGKTKSDGSRVCARMHKIRIEDIQMVIGDLHYELEEVKITSGF